MNERTDYIRSYKEAYRRATEERKKQQNDCGEHQSRAEGWQTAKASRGHCAQQGGQEPKG